MEEPAYQCPGEADQIPAVVHRARMAAGFEGCRDCIWNRATEHHLTDEAIGRRAPNGIRRTEYGVRGAYLNAIDRARASLLASVFASQLAIAQPVNAEEVKWAGEDSVPLHSGFHTNKVTAALPGLVIVGYDNDPNSPDLFTGVVQAIRQTGLHVLDIGSCTAASLQDAVDRRKAIGGVIVTSAESIAGEIGLDVFDRLGQAVSVPWQKFGIRIRLQFTAESEQQTVTDSEAEQFAQDLRRQSELGDAASSTSSLVNRDKPGELLLPELHQSHAAQPGRRRRSGQLQTESIESAYRNSLLKWWQRPKSSELIRIFSQNELVTKRIEWLASACSTVVEIHEEKRAEAFIREGGPRQPVTVEIGQDDRWLTVWSKTGRRLRNSEVITWLNQRLSHSFRHVTAHPVDQFRMIRLMDIAGPDSGNAHQATIDGVAVLGLLLSLNDSGRYPLPL